VKHHTPTVGDNKKKKRKDLFSGKGGVCGGPFQLRKARSPGLILAEGGGTMVGNHQLYERGRTRNLHPLALIGNSRKSNYRKS